MVQQTNSGDRSVEKYRVSNWPFIAKFAVTPVIALLLFGVLTFSGLSGINQQQNSIETLVNVDMQNSVSLSGIVADVHATSADVYRMMTLQAAGDEALDVTATTEQTMAKVDAIIAELTAYQEGLNAQAEKDALSGAIEQLGNYKGTIEFIGSMLELDFQSVVSFLENFDKYSAEVAASVDASVQKTIAASEARAAEAAATANQTGNLFIFTAVFAVIVLSAIGLMVARSTIRSIQDIAQATIKVAKGDMTVDLVALERGDELKAIVASLQDFKDHLAEVEKMREENAGLEEKAESDRREAMIAMADTFELAVQRAVDEVSDTASNLESEATTMKTIAASASSNVNNVTSASTQSSQNVQTVAAASEELAASFVEISRQVEQAAVVSKDASDQAEKTDTQVGQLSEMANHIGSVVEVIRDIAAQTNLLALNATIEAARAGEAGKGFAVVASEVKGLANQTAKATEDITSQVETMQGTTLDTVEAIKAISLTIKQIDEISSTIASAVTEQQSATSEISRSVQSAAASSSEVNLGMDSLRDASEQTGSAAANVLDSSKTVAERSVDLRNEVAKFLGEMRAS